VLDGDGPVRTQPLADERGLQRLPARGPRHPDAAAPEIRWIEAS
jgi:hypothetical protein